MTMTTLHSRCFGASRRLRRLPTPRHVPHTMSRYAALHVSLGFGYAVHGVGCVVHVWIFRSFVQVGRLYVYTQNDSRGHVPGSRGAGSGLTWHQTLRMRCLPRPICAVTHEEENRETGAVFVHKSGPLLPRGIKFLAHRTSGSQINKHLLHNTELLQALFQPQVYNYNPLTTQPSHQPSPCPTPT